MRGGRAAAAALVLLVAMGVAAMLSGCAVAGVLADAAKPKIPAVYELKPVSTLVLVEDRSLLLRDPSLTTFIANAVASDLREHEALEGAKIVEQSQLAELAGEFGRQFDTLGIDEIGQRLGARQVIYVEMRRVRLERAPGLWDPHAVAGVKVIDAVSRQRMFPAAESIEGVSTGPRGRPVVAELPVETPDRGDRAYEAAVLTKLSRALASRVSELFYKHRGRQPGDSLPG